MADINSDKWIQPEDMVDSKQVQMKSLTEFAKGLGYTRNLLKGYFSSNDYDNKKRRNISFATMVKLHNNYYHDTHQNYLKWPFNFSTYKIRKAKAAKIINICHLQMNKKTGYIRATSNIVSFTFQEYEAFLDMKYL